MALTTAAALFSAPAPAVAQPTSSSTVPATTATTATTAATSTTTPTTVVASPSSTLVVAPVPTAPTAPPNTPPPFVVTPAPSPSGAAPPGTGFDDPANRSNPASASLSPDAVAAQLGNLARTSPSSTDALLAALRPLQDYGVSADDAAMRGMGRFPVAGAAYYRDDFGDARSGPPPHLHAGNDIFAAFNTPVRAPADGRVEFSDSGLGGKAATVTEPDGTYYYMAHLNGFAPDLANGSPVTAGQVVGFNGDSGNARGGTPHVHFEIRPRGGAAVNPKPILDQWLADALAAVPALLAPYQQSIQQGGENSRAIMAVGLARHIEQGFGRGAPFALTKPAEDGDLGQPLAESLIDPLTPVLLRRS
ncbi:MAG: M23 family metallopeptidase [Acidimicrobiales bacterium]